MCSGGKCAVVCGAGTTTCDVGGKPQCIDPDFDPASCGACGKACPAGELCSMGTCGVACGEGSTKCGETYTNTAFDPKNCSGCGLGCFTGAFAVGYCAEDFAAFSARLDTVIATAAPWTVARRRSTRSRTVARRRRRRPAVRAFNSSRHGDAPRSRFESQRPRWIAIASSFAARADAGRDERTGRERNTVAGRTRPWPNLALTDAAPPSLV